MMKVITHADFYLMTWIILDEKELNRYRGDGIFIDAMVNFDFSINGKSNVMKDELEYFNQKECEIIMKLRTEYINLNHYLHHVNYHVDGKCKNCGVAETVSHFLIDCKGSSEAVASLHKDSINYEKARCQMKKRLRDIAIFYKNEENFNVKNLLFPHIWQGIPKRDHNYKATKQKYLDKRVAILKTVVNFVHRTKRFKNDYGI